MQTITATLVNYYHLCHRKLWLHAHSIQMEHTSEAVAEGKLIGDSSYTHRSDKYTELVFDGVKIDFYDAKNRVVHEVKKSNRAEEAHRAQVKYYLWILERNGIKGAKGVLEYPKLRHTEGVELTDADRKLIPQWLDAIARIVDSESCPPVINKANCKKCSFYDFCYAAE
ncbi:MAG: CRISPR-associated protein Cas4 [Saprospiraceae bacterium]|nr:CRISPR-associated protein Cas4 [Saprospiraceae bacterium]